MLTLRSASRLRATFFMMHPTDHRLNAALQGAMSRIRATATAAAERTVDSLGIAAMSAAHTKQRDAYLSAQFELRRKLPEFNRRFGDVLIERVTKEVSPSSSGRSLATTDWHSLSLVADDEVEELVSADRLGQTIAEECEWELREVAAYMGSLLRTGRAEQERNPLRPEVIGKALYRAIECVSEQKETRKILGRELGRSMAQAMRACYGEIVQEFQSRGVQPVGLAVKTVAGPGNDMRYNTGYDSGFHPSGYDTGGPTSRFTSTPDEETLGLPTAGTGAGLSRPGRMGGGRGGGWGGGSGGGPPGQTFGTIDPHMMELIRRLAFLGSHPVDFDPGPSTGGSGTMRASGRGTGSVFDLPGTGLAGARLMAANVIRAASRRAGAGLDRRTRSHGDRRGRRPVRPDPLRPEGAAADGAPDRAAAVAGAARCARRRHVLLVAPAPGAPFRQPHRVAGLRLRRLQRGPGARVPRAGARPRAADRRRRLRPDGGVRVEARRARAVHRAAHREGHAGARLDRDAARRQGPRAAAAAALHAGAEGVARPASDPRLHARLPRAGVEPGGDAHRAPRRCERAEHATLPACGPRARDERAAEGLSDASQGLPDEAAAADEGPERRSQPHRLAGSTRRRTSSESCCLPTPSR